MGTKIITFGEIMLRLSTPGHLRFANPTRMRLPLVVEKPT